MSAITNIRCSQDLLIKARDWVRENDPDDEYDLYGKLDYLAQEYCTWLQEGEVDDDCARAIAGAFADDQPQEALSALSRWCEEKGYDTLGAMIDDVRTAYA